MHVPIIQNYMFIFYSFFICLPQAWTSGDAGIGWRTREAPRWTPMVQKRWRRGIKWRWITKKKGNVFSLFHYVKERDNIFGFLLHGGILIPQPSLQSQVIPTPKEMKSREKAMTEQSQDKENLARWVHFDPFTMYHHCIKAFNEFSELIFILLLAEATNTTLAHPLSTLLQFPHDMASFYINFLY